ncbi:hypothetical protein EPIR_1769 [Erwinia piriflorinigrans CFBP 5888]|uniref:Uncharacterized protein n=1 Tax=Erwinia piriflorinigrans CFBP 5888 TaxID=1161919 RepID=V5Z7A9_9GAMM|nr:hypothetical protein EPIR_1769 [Erwinia piriflorinigrans CFBP 5888]
MKKSGYLMRHNASHAPEWPAIVMQSARKYCFTAYDPDADY